MELGATHTIQVTTRDSKCLAKQIVETLGCHADKTIECSGAEPSVATGIFVSVYMYGTRPKKVSGLSQYLPVLPQYFCRYFRGYFCWYLLYSTIEAHNARKEVFHKKRTAVHTQLISSFVDRCLYCRCAMYQASVLLRFTHRQCCTDCTRQRSRAYARVLSKYCEKSRSSLQREQH